MGLEKFAVTFCSNVECDECPVFIENYETRTQNEKCNQHMPCCENLIKWLRARSIDWATQIVEDVI